jgi:hypothetical protein
MWFFGSTAVVFLFLLGPVEGFLTIFQALLRYEAPSLVFVSVFGGTLSYLVRGLLGN